MKYTNDLGLPQPFVDAVTSDYRHKENRYSVTEVIGGTCEAVLKRIYEDEIVEDVSERIWALLGTAAHKVLQESEATETQLQENWLSVPIDNTGYELSGVFDLYDDATGTVTDYKVTSTWTVIFGDFEKWREQTLLYCWMLRKHGFDARRGEIVAIMRDHSMRKAKTESGYPKHPVFRIGWDFTGEDFMIAENEVTQWFKELDVQLKAIRAGKNVAPCEPELRWHKPDTWAVVKDGNKKASRVLNSEVDAEVYRSALEEKTGKKHHVEFRPGEDAKCEGYCAVAPWCPYWQSVEKGSE